MGLGRGALVEVTVGDDPDAWSAIGFAVDGDGVSRVGGVRIRPVGAGGRRGLLGWTLAGAVDDVGDRDVRDVDGLPTTVATATATGGNAATTAHPNGATGLDHLVVVTPDLDRTTTALAALGLDARIGYVDGDDEEFPTLQSVLSHAAEERTARFEQARAAGIDLTDSGELIV